MKLEKLDLSSITRQAHRCKTVVHIVSPEGIEEWIRLGQVDLCKSGDRDLRYFLHSKVKGSVTDESHDTPYAIRLPIIGLEFERVRFHQTILHGYVDPNIDEFNSVCGYFAIPTPDYTPKVLYECTTCDEPHPIVERFLPPFNAALYEQVKGKQIEIHIFTVYDDSQD